MACRWICDKPLSQPMMFLHIETYMRQSTSMCYLARMRASRPWQHRASQSNITRNNKVKNIGDVQGELIAHTKWLLVHTSKGHGVEMGTVAFFPGFIAIPSRIQSPANRLFSLFRLTNARYLIRPVSVALLGGQPSGDHWIHLTKGQWCRSNSHDIVMCWVKRCLELDTFHECMCYVWDTYQILLSDILFNASDYQICTGHMWRL